VMYRTPGRTRIEVAGGAGWIPAILPASARVAVELGRRQTRLRLGVDLRMAVGRLGEEGAREALLVVTDSSAGVTAGIAWGRH